MAFFQVRIYSVVRDIQKTNNFKTDAFDQKDFGCLGYMNDDKVMMFSRTFKKHTLLSVFSSKMTLAKLPAVGIVYYYVGADARILDFMAQNHRGIVIIGSGRGNYNKAWLEKIESLSAKGIVFVRASRVQQGIVIEDEYFDPDNICVPANTLSGQKALLMLSLAYTNDIKEIKKIFNEY